MPEELETDRVNAEPGTPKPPPKPPGLISVPVNPWDDEKLFDEMSNPKPDPEKESEQSFEENLEAAAQAANPGSSTLDAMKK